MRQPTPDQDLVALRDHLARILAAGCPETTRLSERAWTLVYQALAAVTRGPAEPAQPPQQANLPQPAESTTSALHRAA